MCQSTKPTASAENATSPTTEDASDDDDTWGPWEPPLPPLDPHPPILSWYVAKDLIEEWGEIANSAEDTVIASLDFDVSTVELVLTEDGVRFPGEDPTSPPLVTWPDIVTIAQDEKGAYVLRPGERAERFHLTSGFPHAVEPGLRTHGAHRRVQHAPLRRRCRPDGGHREEDRGGGAHTQGREGPGHMHRLGLHRVDGSGKGEPILILRTGN